MISFNEIKNNATIRTYIQKADETLTALGYTEHSFAHVTKVAEDAGRILSVLGYDAHQVELVKIAGFMHDIGNLVNRADHSQSGAVMAFRILDNMGMDAADLAGIVSAIGNHDEGTGKPINAIAAALFLADKSDVRRSRVRNRDISTFDIHDRVNYSVEMSELSVQKEQNEIRLEIRIDTEYSSVSEYFEIFLGRMIQCRRAAEELGMHFRLVINEQTLM
ncbi:MAG: HD domain-containing protein [Clostridia bacterium]|nr:HD domain-containing protein [Clostridia bacterium]